MTKKGMKALVLILMAATLLIVSACQKKEIASEAGYGAARSGAGAAGRKGIGEQDLSGAAGRPGAGGASIGATKSSV